MTAEPSAKPVPRQATTLGDRPDTGLGNAAIWSTVRKHWATAAVTALAVTLGVAFYTLGQPKIYQAGTTILFDPNPPRPLGAKVQTVVDMGAGSYWDSHEFYETQYKIIQSTRVALLVVAQLGLSHDAAFLANAPPGTPVPMTTVSDESAALTLRSRVKVDAVKDSRLAIVKLEDADPDRAQRVLAALVDTYIAMNLEDAHASTSQAADWLRNQLDKLKVELDSSEMALHEYKQVKNILSVALDDQSNMLRGEMRQLNEVLTQVRTKREEVSARRNELAKVKNDNPTTLPANELLQSTLLQGLRRSYEDAVRERDSLERGGKGKNHPDARAAEGGVDAARLALLAEVRNIQGALDGDMAVIKRQEAGLAGLFEGAKRRAFDLNLLEIEYNRLRRSKENNEKLYSLVLERSKESDLARMLSVNNIRVVDPALRPYKPVRPQVFVNISTGAFVGLLLGIAAALGRAVLDRTVKTPDDLEREIGISFLGLLPEIDINKKHLQAQYGRRRRRPQNSNPVEGGPELIVHNFPTSGIAEASRTVRTNLLFMAPDHPFRTLLITSAGPAEGKTTVACCIAIAMAQAGQRVALIDCDLRRPRVHRIFRKGSAVGLTTALLDNDLSKAIFDSGVPNLSVIPAGPIPPNPAELFHSDRFRSVLDQIEARFDRVIIDSPPVVAVTDAAVLSTLVDGTILVVRAFKTPKDLARHALRALVDVGANIAGTVLNAVNLDRSEYRYSHYYYYQKHGYSSNEQPTEQAPPSGGSPPPHEDVSSPPN